MFILFRGLLSALLELEPTRPAHPVKAYWQKDIYDFIGNEQATQDDREQDGEHRDPTHSTLLSQVMNSVGTWMPAAHRPPVLGILSTARTTARYGEQGS